MEAKFPKPRLSRLP